MTDDKTIGLSRRRVLGGLGAIGVASAGAGIGTTAYFSDQEQFDGNTITAGEFGLTVEQETRKVNQDGIGKDELKFGEYGKDGVWASDRILIKDAKPGDEYKFCWEITVHDNPGYVAAAGDHDDETGAVNGVDPDDLWDVDELSTLGESAEATLKTKYGDKTATVNYDSLADFLASLEGGILVSDKYGKPIKFEPGETVTVCLKIVIPTGVGNELQGAQLSGDTVFYAEQARHNDPEDVRSNAPDAFN